MKQRLLTAFLALTLAMGCCMPALAEESASAPTPTPGPTPAAEQSLDADSSVQAPEAESPPTIPMKSPRRWMVPKHWSSCGTGFRPEPPLML